MGEAAAPLHFEPPHRNDSQDLEPQDSEPPYPYP